MAANVAARGTTHAVRDSATGLIVWLAACGAGICTACEKERLRLYQPLGVEGGPGPACRHCLAEVFGNKIERI